MLMRKKERKVIVLNYHGLLKYFEYCETARQFFLD